MIMRLLATCYNYKKPDKFTTLLKFTEMNLLLCAFLLLQVVISSSIHYYQSDAGFPDEVDVLKDTAVESCFKTIIRTVDQSDDDEDEDNHAPVGQQITRQCCEGWYTPEGKPLCSAKKREAYNELKTTASDECDNRLKELEKLVKSRWPSSRGSSIGYVFIRYLKQKIASLEEANKKQEEKIKYLEEQLLNASSFTVEVVEFTPAPVERAALTSSDPCETATCPDHLEAMCMVTSRCGKDIAVFVNEELRTVNCNSNLPCDLLPPTFCPDDPCLGAYCHGYPDAICVVTECDCKPSFMLPDGSKVTCANVDAFTPEPTPPNHTMSVETIIS